MKMIDEEEMTVKELNNNMRCFEIYRANEKQP